MSFASLSLPPPLQQALEALDYHKASDIQLQAIPLILAGKDLLAGAQTGTGKTAAFALPILAQLLKRKQSSGAAKVLILTPTRELTQQVYNSFKKYAQFTDLVTVQVYGGASINVQIEQIQQGLDILVATPGRLLDLLYNGHLSLAQIDTLVLDEADRMLDLGFKDDIKRIIKKLPQQRQTLLFSATLSDDIFTLSQGFLNDPERVEVSPSNTAAETVEQITYNVDPDQKRALCSYLIGSKNWQQVLIFTRTKKMADALAVEMKKDGLVCAAIHGDKSQGAREKALQQFKDNTCRVLIATDVAARGLDIKQLQYVINYELPYNAEDYIHRIGRTGRAGEAGSAVSLVSEEELYLLKDIETLLNTTLLQQWFPGFEPDLDRVMGKSNAPKSSQNKRQARAKALGLKSSKNKKRSTRPRR